MFRKAFLMASLTLGSALSVLAAAAADKDAAVKDEMKRLDGVWVIESILRDPREKGADEGKGIRCIIKDGKVVVKLPGEDKEAGRCTITIDPAAKPKTLDITPDGEKESILAIYELDGDALKICWGSLEKKERPTDFASKPGSMQSLLVLKREKP